MNVLSSTSCEERPCIDIHVTDTNSDNDLGLYRISITTEDRHPMDNRSSTSSEERLCIDIYVTDTIYEDLGIDRFGRWRDMRWTFDRHHDLKSVPAKMPM